MEAGAEEEKNIVLVDWRFGPAMAMAAASTSSSPAIAPRMGGVKMQIPFGVGDEEQASKVNDL